MLIHQSQRFVESMASSALTLKAAQSIDAKLAEQRKAAIEQPQVVVAPSSSSSAASAASAAGSAVASTLGGNSTFCDTSRQPPSVSCLTRTTDNYQWLCVQRDSSFASQLLELLSAMNLIRAPTLDECRQQSLAQLVRIQQLLSVNAQDPLSKQLSQALCDPYFPAPQSLDTLVEAGARPGQQKVKASWRRLPEIKPNGIVLPESQFSLSSIQQGDLEDCYLLSALSVLAKHYTLASRIFVHPNPLSSQGVHCCMLFQDGLWRPVLVDDQFVALPSLDGGLSNSFELTFARCGNELWLPIIEKCYAKLYGGFESIIGGLVHEALQDLTGGSVDEIALDDATNRVDPEALWVRLTSYFKQGYLMGCGNPKTGARQFDTRNGIVQGHAYALLDMKQVDEFRLVKLRNPVSVFWGSFRIPFSHGSSNMCPVCSGVTLNGLVISATLL